MSANEIEKRTEEKEKIRIQPACSICENKDSIMLCLEMPGVTKQNLDIRVENNELHILGPREYQPAEGTFLLRERREGDFNRVFTLDDTIDPNRIEASLENGVLTVTLHLKEAEKPRKIEIKPN